MLERLLDGDEVQQCQVKDLREGDLFRVLGTGGVFMKAASDAYIQDWPEMSHRTLWGVAIQDHS